MARREDSGEGTGRSERIVMVLENNAYPRDVRVRCEAESLVGAGHAVTVLAPRGPGQSRRELVGGVEVVRFGGIDGSGRGIAGFLGEYAVALVALHWGALRQLARGATVLHLHNPPDVFFGAGALYRLLGRRVIFDHHDLFPETIEVKFGPGLMSRVARWCQNRTFSVADQVLATNESYAAVARADGRKRPEDVTVVRNAPPPSWLGRPRHRREGELGRLRLAYLGSISIQDGVEGLAPVLAHIARSDSEVDVHLTIVGEGDGRAAVERALAEHGVADRVTFAGWVAREAVPDLLQAADVCVDPAPATDVNNRSTMMKIAEYLALGMPVVAYDLLETRRTAQDAALLVRPGDPIAFADALLSLARDPDLRSDLERRARERAAQLTWDRSEAALLGAYRRLRGGVGFVRG